MPQTLMKTEEQRLKIVNKLATADEPVQPDKASPNEYILALENPFQSLTWERWQELQARTIQSLSSFRLAAERKLPQMIVLHALSLQEVALELYKEACLWVPPYPQKVREQLIAQRSTWLSPEELENWTKYCDCDDDDDNDGLVRYTPFHGFSWEDWRKQQAQAIESLTSFLAAAEYKDAMSIMHSAITLQDVATECQKEASIWVLNTPRRQ